ncbi:RNA-binding protein [Halobacteriovorax sp. HLS]|uniref:RNA recognition motif domain-containing protein n=1 Tax=Halobacteriovorax sp. HLS TaxID=2234000 RepID=UPI000FDA70A6|nr:RNA-binding protein [Halobacteriovorax sp. HLS]
MKTEKRDFKRSSSKNTARVGKTTNAKRPNSFTKASSPKKPVKFDPNAQKNPVVYIGNLNYKKDDFGVMKLFKPFGYVEKVNLILDEKTEKSKGIAFVEMQTKKAALDAVAALNGKVIDGRTVKVSIALEREGMDMSKAAHAPKPKPLSKNEEKSIIKKSKIKKVGLDVLFQSTNR